MIQMFHTYILNFPTLAINGGTLQQQFQVETAYRFEMMKLSAFVYDAAGLGVSENVLPRLGVLLQDGATSRNLISGEAPLRTLFGTGELPFILPARHKVIGGATFLASVFNRHTAIVYSVVLAFSGILIPVNAPEIVRARAR